MNLTDNRYQDLTNLINLYNESGKIILTGKKDIDYHILNELNIKDLSIVCRSNKYTQQLCSKEFWVQKFKNENLPLYIENLTATQWLEKYKKIKLSMINAKYALKTYDIQYENGGELIEIIHLEYTPMREVINTFKKLNYNKEIKDILITPGENEYKIEFIDTQRHLDKFIFTYEEVLLLLTYCYYYKFNTQHPVYCEDIPLLIDDTNIIHYLVPEYITVVYERYGIFKTLKKVNT